MPCHNLARLGQGVLALRALQVGFGRTSSTTTAQETKRNLLGFKDGTDNLLAGDTPRSRSSSGSTMSGSRTGWSGGPTWSLAGSGPGSSLGGNAARGQEAAVGRFKRSGAPLGGRHEHDPVDLSATGAHGLPLNPDGAHIGSRARWPTPDSALAARLRLRRRRRPRLGRARCRALLHLLPEGPALQFTAIQRRLATNDALHGYLVHTSRASTRAHGALPREGWGQVVLG